MIPLWPGPVPIIVGLVLTGIAGGTPHPAFHVKRSTRHSANRQLAVGTPLPPLSPFYVKRSHSPAPLAIRVSRETVNQTTYVRARRPDDGTTPLAPGPFRPAVRATAPLLKQTSGLPSSRCWIPTYEDTTKRRNAWPCWTSISYPIDDRSYLPFGFFQSRVAPLFYCPSRFQRRPRPETPIRGVNDYSFLTFRHQCKMCRSGLFVPSSAAPAVLTRLRRRSMVFREDNVLKAAISASPTWV